MFNKVGLERAGYTVEQMSAIKFLFKMFYREGHNRQQAIELVERSPFAASAEVQAYVAFAKASERGLTGGSK